MKSRSFAVACVALTDLAASAQVHRCKDSTGKLMFSDRPCDIGQSGEQIIRKPSPAEIRREREQAFQAEARKQDQRLAEQEREWRQSQGKAQMAPMPLPAGQQPKDDWQARKDRENAQTSASSITNNKGRFDAKAEAEREAQRKEEARRRAAQQSPPSTITHCVPGFCYDNNGGVYHKAGPDVMTGPNGRTCFKAGPNWNCN